MLLLALIVPLVGFGLMMFLEWVKVHVLSTPAMTRLPVVLGTLTVAWLVAGCSAAGSTPATAAGEAAEAFTAAATSDPASACSLLAPETRREIEGDSGQCARGITDAELPQTGRVLDVQVYGLDAMVRLEHDTMFLALFDGGWRVTAAGCTPQEQDRPYSCDIKGA